MKPEQAEILFIEELFSRSQEKGIAKNEKLEAVDKLTGDASTRRYYRLFTDKKSYVVCLDNPQLDLSVPHPFVSKQRFLEENGLRVTRVLDSQMSKGYILEEDLGDMTLLSYLTNLKDVEEEYATYEKIVNQLIQMHRLDPVAVKRSGLFELSFDHEKLMQEMDFTFKFFFERYLKVNSPDMELILREELSKICKRIADQPMVPTHRDFHSRNIMVIEGEMVIIDFQDARMGLPQYDLVSILDDCYYDLVEGNREKLKKLYFDNLPANAHGQGNYQDFCDFYDDMLIQRVFKAVGSFSYIYATRQDLRYLKYIGFGMEKIRKTLMHNKRYEILRKNLFGIYYAG
jgi:N-acetylmuramate 1-kinase